MKKNTVRRFLTLSVILIAVFSTAPVLAAGLQVHPGKIAIEMKPGGYHNTILLVRNDQKDESHYEVYIQEEYENWASFDIEAFSLLSHQSKNVEITITPPATASGEHKVYIRVCSVNPSSGVVVGAGIKVPVYISLSEKTMFLPELTAEDESTKWPLIWGVIAVITVIAMTLGIVFWRRNPKA